MKSNISFLSVLLSGARRMPLTQCRCDLAHGQALGSGPASPGSRQADVVPGRQWGPAMSPKHRPGPPASRMGFLLLSFFFPAGTVGPLAPVFGPCTSCLPRCNPPCSQTLLSPPDTYDQLGRQETGPFSTLPLRAGPSREKRHEILLYPLPKPAGSPLCLFPSCTTSVHVTVIEELTNSTLPTPTHSSKPLSQCHLLSEALTSIRRHPSSQSTLPCFGSIQEDVIKQIVVRQSNKTLRIPFLCLTE